MIRVLLAALVLSGSCGGSSDQSASPTAPVVARSTANPLITRDTPGMVAEWGIHNINGPSVIRVPDWVEAPLGRYYLYFAHHRGSFIRMAYADHVEGPWTIKPDGVLDLGDVPALDHLASPDVLVDDSRREIRMFFHSVDDTTTWYQTTYLATSSDGLTFLAEGEPKGPPYLRAFEIDGQWWAIAKVRGGPGAVLLRSDRADGVFMEGPVFLEGMRHGTVRVTGDVAVLVFSRIGDTPERLLVTTFDPQRMWDGPYDLEIGELLTPETDYEGALLPVVTSEVGETAEPVHALRDPYLFTDLDGETYLFYSIAGESGIAMARWQP